MENYYLTNLLKSYKSGLIEREKLIREISIFVYNYPLKACRWKEDACSDFFCYFYPRIEKMIESFQLRGIPFEAYLIKSIRLQLKTFAVRKKEGLYELYMLRNLFFWPFLDRQTGYLCSEEYNQYSPTPEEIKLIKKKLEDSIELTEDGAVKDRALKKRITMLFLKNIFSIREEMFPVIAKLIDRNTEWLEKGKLELKSAVENRMTRKTILSERRNKYFWKMFQLEQKMNFAVGAEEKNQIAIQIQNVKNKILKTNSMLKNIPQQPNHRDIAEFMAIPKGSVDSGLYYLKLYLEKKQ